MPPLDYGQLVSHINSHFGKGRIFDRLRGFERDVSLGLDFWDLPNSGGHFLEMASLPREERFELLKQRTKILGFDKIFGTLPEDLSEAGPGFRVWKAPTALEEGFGSFRLSRESFIGKTADEIAAGLHYIMPNIQIDDAVGGASRFRLAGRQIRNDFIQSTAEHVVNLENLKRQTRMVFDVESAGLEVDKGIWQISARLMRGDTQIDELNLHFRNPFMDIGEYAIKGKGMKFDEFYETLRAGGRKVEWEDDFLTGITKFLRMSEQADVLVGQNVAFDIGMIEHGIRPHLDKLGRLGEDFLEKGARAVDTRLFSAMLFSESIEIAPELIRLGKHTPYSMENIMLQTSFVDDLIERLRARPEILDADKFLTSEILDEFGGDRVRAAVMGRIKTGMHFGDIDTFFEDQLFHMQMDVLSGKGEGLLRATSLSGPARRMIVEAGAITPFTKLDQLGGLTPLQYSAQQARIKHFDPDYLPRMSSAHLYERGIFSGWANRALIQSGKIESPLYRGGAGFMQMLADYPGVQQAARKAGLPFAHLSPFERLASTLIGQQRNRFAPMQINAARQGLGELTGSGLVRMTSEARVYGGRNVALPMELLKAAEEADVLRSSFGRVLGEGADAVQTAHWSLVRWEQQGRIHKDIALVADTLFDDDASVRRFTEFLTGLSSDRAAEFGLNDRVRKEVVETLHKYGRQHGIQIGIMGGMGADSVSRVYDLLDQFGLGTDKAEHRLRTILMGELSEQGAKGERFLETTASFLDVPGETIRPDDARYLRHLQATRELSDIIMKAPRENPTVFAAALMSSGAGKIHRTMARHIDKLTPKNLGIAAAVVGGYYLFGRKNRQDKFDQTMDPQGFEDPNFYARYKREMGEEVPTNFGMRGGPDPTAGLVQSLNNAKSRHHQMGPDKYQHLY